MFPFDSIHVFHSIDTKGGALDGGLHMSHVKF